MNQTRFLNQSQPQTLVIATVLLYLNGFFNLISFFRILPLVGIAMAVSGWGIANERRWGYALGVGAAITQVALYVLWFGISSIFDGINAIGFIFDVALVALLLHPMSREYQRIWFE